MKPKAKTLSLFTLSAKIPDEAAAVAYVEAKRWGETPVCPKCGSTKTTRRPKYQHRCNSCRKDFSVRVGTVMEASHLPLRKWIFGMYLMQTSRKGISALQLSKELDTTYRAAWFLGHRLRTACGTEEGELLSGVVEADETFVGGLEENRHQHKKQGVRGKKGKTIVLGLRERGGRTVAMTVPDTHAKTLTAALRAHVSANATLVTDEWRGYHPVGETFYLHKRVNHTLGEYVAPDGATTNAVESVWGVLKRAYKGIFHHWSAKHCGLYAAEVAWRLSAGNVERDIKDRLASLVNACVGRRLTYRTLVG